MVACGWFPDKPKHFDATITEIYVNGERINNWIVFPDPKKIAGIDGKEHIVFEKYLPHYWFYVSPDKKMTTWLSTPNADVNSTINKSGGFPHEASGEMQETNKGE